MAKFMKVEAIAYYALKVLVYLFGFMGMLGFFGFAGSLEHDKITIAQFCLYEIHALGLIGFSYSLYLAGEVVRKDFIKRDRQLQIKNRGQKVRTAHN